MMGPLLLALIAPTSLAQPAHTEAIDAARTQVSTLFSATMKANPRAAGFLVMPEVGTGHHASHVRELSRGTLSIWVSGGLSVHVNPDTLQLASFQWQSTDLPRPAGFDLLLAETLPCVEAQRIAEEVLQTVFQSESPFQIRLLETERNYTYIVGLFFFEVQVDPGFLNHSVSVDRFSGLPIRFNGVPSQNIRIPQPEPDKHVVSPRLAREAALGAQLVTKPYQQIVVESRLTFSTLHLIRNQVANLEDQHIELLERGYALLVYRIDILAADKEGFLFHQVVYVDAYRGEPLGQWSFDDSATGNPAVIYDLRLNIDRVILEFMLTRETRTLWVGHQSIMVPMEKLAALGKDQNDFADLNDVEPNVQGYLRIQENVYVLAEAFLDREVIRVKNIYYAIPPQHVQALRNVQMPKPLLRR